MIGRNILRNAVKCNICGDVIESQYCHDFKTCSCGYVSVDGGADYLRRCVRDRLDGPDNYTELSVVLEPCPFCGGEAHISEGYPHWVFCESCGAKVQGGVIGEEEEGGKAASIAAWNRRCHYE